MKRCPPRHLASGPLKHESKANRLTHSSIRDSLVTLTDEGYACRINVDGLAAAHLLASHLSRAFVFQTSEPFIAGLRPSEYSFRVAYGSQLTQRDLARLLMGIPGLRLEIASPPKSAGASGRQARS